MKMTMRLSGLDNYPNFDWDLTRNFYFLAKLGLLEASEKLGLSESSLLNKMDILENKLGFPLILHDSPIIPVDSALTPKGEKLMNFLDIIYKEIMNKYISNIF